MRLLTTLMLCVLCVAAYPQAKKRDAATVRQEQAQVSQQISETNKKIQDTKRSAQQKLNDLNALNAQITQTNSNIDNINRNIAELNVREKRLNDSIAQIEGKIGVLQQEYAQALRDSRRRRISLSEISLIFSSETFNRALKRSSYFRRVKSMMEEKAESLRLLRTELQQKREALAEIKAGQQRLLAQLSDERARLNGQMQQTQQLVNQLKKEEGALQQALSEQRAKSQRLESELNRIIEEEAREAEARRQAEERRKEEERRLAEQKNKKPSEPSQPEQQKNASQPSQPTKTPSKTESRSKALSGTFASNKGKLPIPVTGQYKIVGTFGLTQYKDLTHVQTDNSGIDIEAQPGANARAVYDGEVSTVVFIDGFKNVVMVRHGEYLTVYTNIDRLDVRKGDKVKTGQSLGHIYIDPHDSGRAVMHFEVRREKQKFNPLEWISR